MTSEPDSLRHFTKDKLFDLKRSKFLNEQMDRFHPSFVSLTVFDAFDEDCDGYLKTEEARMAIYAGGPILYENQVSEALRNADPGVLGNPKSSR